MADAASTSATTPTFPGSKRLVEENLDQIDAAAINTFLLGSDPDGDEIVVKPGKYGPYVKRGDDTASVPEDLAPDELTVDKALELLAMPKSDEPIGELDGYPVYAKNGRYGPYVQWGDPEHMPPGLDKPKMASLFKTMTLDRVTRRRRRAVCCSCPARSAHDPVDGKEIVANNGRYGPYVVKDKDFRTLDSEEQLLTITLEQASEIFKLPKVFKRGAARNMAAAGPLREFGNDPVSERPVVAKRRSLRRVRDRRRDERLDRQGRPDRDDGARAGVRAAGDSPRAGRRQGRRPDQEDGSQESRPEKEDGSQEVSRQEVRRATQAGVSVACTSNIVERHVPQGVRSTPAIRCGQRGRSQ